MSKVTVDYAEIEDHVLHNETKEFMNLAKVYKGKGCYQEFLDAHYNSGKSTLFHLMARQCNLEIIKQFFDYTESIMGKNYLTYELNTKQDRNGRTFLIIVAKHLEEEVVMWLLKEYALDPGYYAAYNRASALTYLIKRKLSDCLVRALGMIDITKMSEDGFKWFKTDMDKLKEAMTVQELIKDKWMRAITSKHRFNGRISKIIPEATSDVMDFSGQNRLRQIMRHVAGQLYFRWKYYLGAGELTDVQIMYMIKTVDKENPNPKPLMFVACTPLEVADYIKDDFKIRSLKEVLLKQYSCANDTEGNTRTRRFSEKLKARVWGTRVTKQSKESREVVNILHCDKKKVQKTVKLKTRTKLPYLDLTENAFYLIIPGGNYDSNTHAEESLCDVSRHLEPAWEHKTIIYGKNRSCLSCCGRMKSESIDEYNNHQGFLYTNAMSYQDEEAAEYTLSLTYTEPSYMTTIQDNDEKLEYTKTTVGCNTARAEGHDDASKYIKHYDTASDSEPDTAK